MRIILRALAGILIMVGMGSAQIPVKPVDGNGNELIQASGGKRYTAYLQAITVAGTTITSTATYVQLLFCTNTSGGAVTITVADTQGSPVTFGNTVSIAANSMMLIHSSPVGLYMQGIKITASSNSAVSCQVQGVQ